MGIPKGADLGGIRTVDDLMTRCDVDEVTDCWHWRLSFDQGSPRVSYICPTAKKRVTTRGRRAAVVLSRGEAISTKVACFATADCHSVDCCNPTHCRTGTRRAAGAALAKSGRMKNLPQKVAAALRSVMKMRHLTPAQAAEIKDSDEPTRALAERYGVAMSVIRDCRSGRSYAPRGASVFSAAARGALTPA